MRCSSSCPFTTVSIDGVCQCESAFYRIEAEPLVCSNNCPVNSSDVDGICECNSGLFALGTGVNTILTCSCKDKTQIIVKS